MLCSSTQNKEASQAEQSQQEGGDSKKEQYKWRLKQLLGSEQTDAPGYQSDLNTTESVCTEDFTTKFKEGMVDPQSDFSGEPSSDDGTPGCSPSGERSSKKTSEESVVEPESFLSISKASTAEREADNEIIVLNTARRLDIVQQFKQDLESDLQGTVAEVEETPGTGLLSRNRRDSLESLGGRISRLSQSNTPDSQSILGKERSVAHSSVAHSSSPVELFREGGSPSVISQKDNVKEPPCLSIGTNQESIHQETCGSPALKEMFPSCERSSVRGNGERRLGQENFTNGTNLSGSTYVSQSSTCSDMSVSMFKEKDALSRDRCPSPIKLSNEKENTSCIQEANGSDPEERNGNSCQPERKGAHHEFGVVSISSFQQRTVSRSESCPYIHGSSYRLEAANLLPESNHFLTTSGSRHIRSSSLSSRSSAAKGQFNSHRPSSPSSDRKIVSHRATAGINQKTCENFGSESSLNTIGTGEYVDSFQAVAVKHVAGVPVKSFDEVTIDSDLDSVKTDRVRKHFQKALSTRNGFVSAKSTAADDLYSDQSDPDTAKLQQIERTFRDILRRKKSSTQGLKSVPVAAPFGCRSTKRPRSPRKDACRFESSDRTVTDEEEEEEEESLEQRFTESSREWRTSSPVKWNSCSKRGGELSWGRSLGSEISEAHQRSSRLLDSDRQILEESVSRLRRDLAVEEETLSHRKAQVQEIEQSLTEALQKKKHAVQELESVKCAVEKSQKEARGLEIRVRGSKSQAEETRAELAVLEYKRDSCLQEVQTLEEELSVLRRQCSATHNSQQSTLQNQVSSLSAEREELRARLRLKEGSLSVLERQELEWQLSCTRSELFTEQRSARDKISLLQEQLEDCQVELEERATQEALLQERSRRLEQQLREMNRRQEEQTQKLALQSSEASQALSRQVQEASVQLLERDGKISALERILSEKELELLRLREGQAALQAEREALVTARETLTQEHQSQLQQLHRDKQLEEEQAKQQLKEELDLIKQQEIQQVREQAEEDKLEAMNYQALSFTLETEKLALKIQLKDEEIVKLKEAVRQQEVSMRKLAEELKLEAKEMVQGALLREHRKWEAEKTEELQRQRGILEDESRRAMHSIKEDQEREKRKALSLQNKVIELQTRVQELEFESRALQREKQEAVSEVRSSLREEKQEEILRVKEEMDQEKAREVERLRLRLEQEEAEVQRLRAGLGEAARREKELQTQAERLERGAVLDLSLEYDRIQDLLHSKRERGAGASPARQRHSSPSRLSLPQAVQALRGACEEQQQHILELHQELDTQRRTVLHIQRDKDRELQQQREELYLEKEAAVKSIKERLIQEHIEEISKLQRPLLKDSGGSECQSLRQQLREKDSELRAIQRNMTHWKDETAAKLACKFEEELNSELEKCKSDLLKQRRMSKNKPDHERKIEKLESEMRRLSVERSETAPLRSASTPSLSTAPPPGPQDFSTLKLLRHLQSRVKQLRAENTIYHPGSQDDLAGSYRETIRMTPERLPTRFKSSTRKPLM